MAFTKINASGVDAYVSFDDTVKIIVPASGAVTLPKDSFVKLLNYFKGYAFLLAQKELHNKYYNAKLSSDLGYFVESADGSLIIVDVSLDQLGKYASVTFKTLDTDTAAVKYELRLSAPMVRGIIEEAALHGIESTAKSYQGIQFVDSLPDETSAKKNTVYRLSDKFYLLNDAEDALDEIKVAFEDKLPSAEVKGKEGVIYQLTRPQEEPDASLRFTEGEGNGNPKDIHFDPGLYTFTAATNTFTLLDLSVKKVSSLPEIPTDDKKKSNISETTLYVLTADEKVSDGETRKKGSAWTYKDGSFTEEKRPIMVTQRLPYTKLAVDGTYYDVQNFVTKFSDGKFTKIGKVVMIRNGQLPDVSTVKLDPDYIYTLKKNQGEKKLNSSWVFNMDSKEFEKYVDPTKEETKTVAP